MSPKSGIVLIMSNISDLKRVALPRYSNAGNGSLWLEFMRAFWNPPGTAINSPYALMEAAGSGNTMRPGCMPGAGFMPHYATEPVWR